MVFRKKQEGNLKCSASECLGIYTGIRAFLMIKMPQLQVILQVVGSYTALAELIDVLQSVSRNRRTATDLAHSITGYVHAHQQAYSNTLWVPKFHHLQHIAGMICHHKVVVGCFVHERKHRVAKRFAENIRSVGYNFGSYILKEVLFTNVQDLSDKDFDQLHIGLVHPIPANAKVSGLLQNAMGLHGMVMCARRAHYALGSVLSTTL